MNDIFYNILLTAQMDADDTPHYYDSVVCICSFIAYIFLSWHLSSTTIDTCVLQKLPNRTDKIVS